MNPVSPWAATDTLFDSHKTEALYTKIINQYKVEVHCIHDSAWILITMPVGTRIALRCAHSSTSPLELLNVHITGNAINFQLQALIGIFTVALRFPDNTQNLLHYTSVLEIARPLVIPFWPRDLTVLGKAGQRKEPDGKVHITQAGTRSGLQFFTIDNVQAGSILYMQNLTALNDYCESTGTSAAEVIGGQWPELGFALPNTKDKPLPVSKITVSDAFLAFAENKPADEFDLAKQFLDLLALIYLHLPRPGTQYHHWPDILEKGLNDLQNNHGCWSHAGGHDYLNAYLCDYATPPEIMVQLAVLLPLMDYHHWSKKDLPAIHTIKSGIKAFYSETLGTVVRWLPALEKELDGSEEQLKPNVMDSWYLHHPLLNLSRLALQGDKNAEKLFLDSLPFAIKVARHFKYNWPVFYNMETLETIKAETAKGKGGEKDVAGLYSHVMLQAWQLTKDKKYLLEAEKSAKTLQGKGFDIFYQANNTAFSANAMMRLYKETGKKLYLNLSYLCLAAIFKNVHLWQCNYGYAKNYPTFFGVFPLNDAPYTAAYEEQEVFATLHEFLKLSEKENLPPAINILIPEFIRYIVHRAAYYYPPNLPKEMLAEEIKMGQLDEKLWIAVEDINDGWEKSGSVGQEVYGAGVAFGIVPRHFHDVPGNSFMVYIDYPITPVRQTKKQTFTFKVGGDPRLGCRMLIIKKGDNPIPSLTVLAIDSKKESKLDSQLTKDGHIEYSIQGNQSIKINWK